MKHRFLLHNLSHTVLAINMSEIGLPKEIYPPDGKLQMVVTLRFQCWDDAEQYLRGLGADLASLRLVSEELKKKAAAVLTIL
jgi:hypothetical protein